MLYQAPVLARSEQVKIFLEIRDALEQISRSHTKEFQGDDQCRGRDYRHSHDDRQSIGGDQTFENQLFDNFEGLSTVDP
jgi:hypothetical protein